MADIAIFRINYKSDFILTINGDAGWSVPFCIKFWTGAPSQGYFVGYNGSTYTNCRIGDDPTKLVVLFDDHHLPIGELKMQIAYHTTIEEFPGSVYDEVTNASDVIVSIDGTEYQVMLDVNGETAPEIQFSLPAYANEAQRIANEQERQREFAQMQEENAQAVEGAENVNAELSGTVLTVTDRNGTQHTSDVQGQPGAPGIGVPAGGSTGQVLAKKSDNNYDTEWVNQQGGGGSSQADWNQTNTEADDYIKNKPTIFGASGNDHKSGLVPDPGITAGTTKYLREDSQWIELATTNDVNNLQPPSGEIDPQTWKDEEWALTEKNRIISKVKSKYNHEIVVFGFNTDQHIRHETNRAYYTDPVLRGLRSLRGIADEIPLSLICLAGDAAGYVTETTQEKVDADIQEIINAVDTTKCPVLYITGNHDGGQNVTPEWTTTDGRNMFNSALKRNVVRKEIGHFDNRSTNCWFDDEANKVRFIILDHWARSTGPREGAGRTYTAMRDILSDALDDVKLYNSDWGVIFLSHNVLRSVEGNNYDPPVSSDWDDTIKPAIDNGLYIIGCFNGHCHYDGNGIKDNTLLICSQTAGIQAAEESFDGITYSHTPNTSTETSFDVFVIDKTDHKIYGYKYGAGMDRLFYYGKDNPRMMLCNLSGTVSSGGNAVSGTVTATHHNTVYRCILDANGAYSFPYLCPECDWVIKVISNDAEIYSETYSATEGVITKNIEINN